MRSRRIYHRLRGQGALQVAKDPFAGLIIIAESGDVSERLAASREPGRLPAADRLLRGEPDLGGGGKLPQKIYQNGEL